MRILKTILLLVLIVLITGVCGCMNKQNEEVKVENMRSYATNKYGKEFTVENFQDAKDESYTNILTLSDGEYIFNVYQSAGSEASDDFAQVVVNKKFADSIATKSGSDLAVYVNYMFADGSKMSLDYAKQSDISTILNDYSLVKVVVVVATDKDFEECKEELYGVYREVISAFPKYIDFEAIKVASASTDLKDMLSNLPAFYDNAWDKFTEIDSYLSATDTGISSASELVKGVD